MLLTFTALSDASISLEGTSATPAPSLPPFFNMSGAPAPKSPLTSRILAPGMLFPLRCPDMPENEITFLIAESAKSSAPACLRSNSKLFVDRSKRISARTAPWAMISSALSSPGTLFRKMAFPLSGADVPNSLSKTERTRSTPSPMQGLMSPGLLISKDRTAEPQPHPAPRTRVPHASHHLKDVFP